MFNASPGKGCAIRARLEQTDSKAKLKRGKETISANAQVLIFKLKIRNNKEYQIKK